MAIRRTALSRWLFAALAVGLAFIVRSVFSSWFPPGYPFLTFFPAAVLATYVSGTRPGIVAAFVSGVLAWTFFIAPADPLHFNGPNLFAMSFYALIVGTLVALIHFMQKALERLAEQRELNATLYERQRMMFAEMQHRVANNFSFIVSLLSLQKRLVEANPDQAAGIFDDAMRRIATMSRLHRRLYTPEAAELALEEHLRLLGEDLVDASGREGIAIEVTAAPVTIELSRLVTLSMLISEVATNSLKHAFDGAARGTIRIALDQTHSGELLLAVTDDGRGMPDEAAPRRRGLGTNIVAGFARQLGGRIEMRPGADGRGLCTELRFPAG